MLKQVIVVEGKSDIQRIAQAVEADCIATEGFTLRKGVIDMIRVAYEKRGIIILTDPDTAGERIRRVLTKKFPNAQHAFVPRDEAFANDDIGIEQASPESIRKALSTLSLQRSPSPRVSPPKRSAALTMRLSRRSSMSFSWIVRRLHVSMTL